jgi:hypothetical protein
MRAKSACRPSCPSNEDILALFNAEPEPDPLAVVETVGELRCSARSSETSSRRTSPTGWILNRWGLCPS